MEVVNDLRGEWGEKLESIVELDYREMFVAKGVLHGLSEFIGRVQEMKDEEVTPPEGYEEEEDDERE